MRLEAFQVTELDDEARRLHNTGTWRCLHSPSQHLVSQPWYHFGPGKFLWWGLSCVLREFKQNL